MQIEKTDTEIIIKINIDNLAKGAEAIPGQNYIIKDKVAMTDSFVQYFFEFDGNNDTPDFTELIDAFFHDAYEQGDDWLEEINPENNNRYQ